MKLKRSVMPDLDRAVRGDSITGLSEWQLLERYLDRQDELAFEALVTRHASMVMGVCRRMLGRSADVDDAFQATFLILVRRARDLGPRDAIGPWLHGVATRVAARVRGAEARRRRRLGLLVPLSVSIRVETGGYSDVAEILDHELSRLPLKYRSPIVLCYLEGRTHEEAARELKWPVGTVKGRLARAREMLRRRLDRRGVSPSTGVVGVLSSPELVSVPQGSLVENVLAWSSQGAPGLSAARIVSRSVKKLAEGVLSTMFLNKLKGAALVAAATGFLVTSAAVLGRQQGPSDGPSGAGGQAAVSKQLEAQNLKVYMKKAAPGVTGGMGFSGPGGMPGGRSARDSEGRPTDARSLKILERLEEPVAMAFRDETPLEDVLKYIKQATTTPAYAGIPIYVDPAGLQEAERSLNSTVQIDLEGVPLRRTLQLVLAQLGLVYFVDDGILVITSQDSAEQSALPPSMALPPPVFEKQAKAERGEMTVMEMQEFLELLKLRRQVLELTNPASFRDESGQAHPAPAAAAPAAEQTTELVKELRELIKALKSEKAASATQERKPQIQ